MAQFWFTSAPLPGHLDWGGLLRTAQALQARGHEVLWVSETQIGRLVEAAGVPFAAIPRSGWRWPPPPLPGPGEFVNENMMTLRFRRALDTWLSEELVADGVRALCDLAAERGKPDVIVTDPFLSAAALAAEQIDVPLVVGGWPAGTALDEDQMLYEQRQLGQEAVERLARLCAQFGLGGMNFSDNATPSVQSPLLHISYFSAYWHQGESILPQTRFVGGTIRAPHGPAPAWLDAISPDQPLGMVTLGSTFNQDVGFFVRGAHALHKSGVLPLVVIGYGVSAEDKEMLKRSLPGGSRLLNWVDYDHIFPRIKVLVHHGGMGTTHTAVVHGIPQVITPHAADQRGQARRARQAKVGLEIAPQETLRGQLAPAVSAILTTDFVGEAVARLADRFAELGGAEQAAALLESVAAGTFAVAP